MNSDILERIHPSRTPQQRLSALGVAALLLLVVSSLPARAQSHVYWAGNKIWQANLDGTNQHVLWSSPGSDVAVDPGHGKIFWAINSGSTGKIMVANLDGTGSPTTLLTTTSIDELQIDIGNQMIYWMAWGGVNSNRIYRSSITSPSMQVLPLTPTTLRAIALDPRPSNPHLYYIDNDSVYRADLNGANPVKLQNPIGDIFYGLAIDPCTDRLIATGVSNAVIPNFPLILRADLSDAGNQTVLLQDPLYPYLNVGLSPGKILLDPHSEAMYWIVVNDSSGISTVRRANLNGTLIQPVSSSPAGPTVIAQGPTPFASGLALELADTTCTSVGVNKDLQNSTGQAANDIEILLEGAYSNVNHYDGYPANLFSSYTESPAPGGNTLLTWSNPNNDVQPGQIAHVGFNVPGTSVNILSVSWTHNGTPIGCAPQVSGNTHSWGSPGSQVIYANNSLGCEPVPRYVGALTVEWHARRVPLAALNPRTPRKPLRVDAIRRAPIRLAPKATVAVDVPAAPPSAQFGVIVYKVSKNARLSGPDVTTDFVEFPVERPAKRPLPRRQ
jgi:hypothetical protein